MTSIRNAPVDIASARILQYLRTHNYDDCAIYINRLSSNTFRKILSNDLSIDILIAQLPFSIEIFEVIYSKIFIYDPDAFPVRILKPEQIISKMISAFASSIENPPLKGMDINDERLLSNLSSILRIISYVQPVLFKRLLRQKETIDECIHYFEQSNITSLTSSSTQKNLEETIRHELESTITCCQQAIQRLETKPIRSRTPSSSTHSTPVTHRKHSTIHLPSSFDDIQNRLYQHKSILNLVEPYLSRTKLYPVMDNLTQKVSMDKQILLAYAHIKSHEKQIPIGEPLLPLFKRFAFAYERIIQLWRRVTDSSLIDECTDDVVIDNTTVKGTTGICFERARSQEPRPYQNRYETELLYYKDDISVKNGRTNTAELQFIYAPQTHIINTSFQKQQPPSKLVNRYLSSAAQYLNRTKSFHVPSTNNHSRQYISSNNTINDNLAQSMQNINPRTTIKITSNDLSMSINESNSSTLPLNCNNNNNSINGNKPQGFVNTLRRSLRKNKERFYNKRAATMKSCHSLNTYEQPMNDHQDIHMKISMTPTLFSRRQHLTDSLRNTVKDNNNNKSDQRPPLQPFTIHGREQRNRLLSNGPLVHHHHQLTSILPPAASLQSLSPLVNTTNSIGSMTFTSPMTNLEATSINSDFEEKEKLKNDLQQLKNELQKSKEMIVRLQKSEEQMRERLAEQAQRQLEKGGKFEDLNQTSRPTELIRLYNTLYSQARIDALDALDNIPEMSDAEDLKSKLLFSVVVLAFRHAQNQAKDIRNKIKQILQLSNDKNSVVLEETIEKYLRSTIQKYDVEKVAIEVENQLWITLYDYPTLKSCNELLKYINSACRTAWGLVNQTPPYYIEFQTINYDKQIHERFHTSDNESDTIIEYIWPCLIDGYDRTCVAKGVVLTDEHHLSTSKKTSS